MYNSHHCNSLLKLKNIHYMLSFHYKNIVSFVSFIIVRLLFSIINCFMEKTLPSSSHFLIFVWFFRGEIGVSQSKSIEEVTKLFFLFHLNCFLSHEGNFYFFGLFFEVPIDIMVFWGPFILFWESLIHIWSFFPFPYHFLSVGGPNRLVGRFKSLLGCFLRVLCLLISHRSHKTFLLFLRNWFFSHDPKSMFSLLLGDSIYLSMHSLQCWDV